MLAFKPQKGAVFQLAFSPDGASIATTGRDPIVCVSDAVTGKVRWQLETGMSLSLGLAYSPDGAKLAIVDWGDVVIFNAATGKQIKILPGRGYAVTFTPDGRSVVTADAVPRAGVTRTRITTGDARSIVGVHRLESCNHLRYSPDGKYLAVLGEEGTFLIDGRTEKLVTRHEGAKAAGVGALVFHPTEPLLIFSAGAKLIVYHLNSGERVAERTRSKKYIQEAAITPDGKHLITVSNDTMAVLWETTTWTELREFAWAIGPLKTVAISPDGSRAVCGSDRGRVVVWDLDL
jgi:WD40 repeat protein